MMEKEKNSTTYVQSEYSWTVHIQILASVVFLLVLFIQSSYEGKLWVFFFFLFAICSLMLSFFVVFREKMTRIRIEKDGITLLDFWGRSKLRYPKLQIQGFYTGSFYLKGVTYHYAVFYRSNFPLFRISDEFIGNHREIMKFANENYTFLGEIP